MKVEYSEETSVRKALSFEIEPEQVDREIEARAKEYARKVKLPGFRAGKVPPKVIKQRFRQQVLDDVAEKIVNRVVLPELEGRGLRPLASPRVEDLKIEEGTPMTFRALFETLPLIELPDYRGLPAKTRKPNVTDEDMDRELERLRDESARFDPVEGRPVRAGDFVLVDLTWQPDGGKLDRNENAKLEVGASGTHEDLNAALEGMNPGETKEVHVSYPDDHAEKSLAGKTGKHMVTLKELRQKVLPDLDDEFAKDLGDFASLQELREKLQAQFLLTDERQVEQELKTALLKALAEKADFEVPEALVERQMTARTERAAQALAYRGVDPTKVGMDWPKFRESLRDESVTAAKGDILLDEIARREGIEVLDSELDAELSNLAQRLKKSMEATRAQLEKEGDLAALKARIRDDKTLDLLKASARLEIE